MISAVVGVGQPSFFDLVATAERLEAQDDARAYESGAPSLTRIGKRLDAVFERIKRDRERVFEAANRVEGWIFIPMYQRMLDGENVTFDDIGSAISQVIVDLNLDSLEDFTDGVVRDCFSRWDLRMEMRQYRESEPVEIEPLAPPPSCELCGEPHYDEPCAEVARLDAEDGSRWGQFEPAVRQERRRLSEWRSYRE